MFLLHFLLLFFMEFSGWTKIIPSKTTQPHPYFELSSFPHNLSGTEATGNSFAFPAKLKCHNLEPVPHVCLESIDSRKFKFSSQAFTIDREKEGHSSARTICALIVPLSKSHLGTGNGVNVHTQRFQGHPFCRASSAGCHQAWRRTVFSSVLQKSALMFYRSALHGAPSRKVGAEGKQKQCLSRWWGCRKQEAEGEMGQGGKVFQVRGSWTTRYGPLVVYKKFYWEPVTFI